MIQERNKKIKHLYETTFLTMENIGKEIGTSFMCVFKYVKHNYSKEYRCHRKTECYRNSRLGDKNPNWRMFAESHPNYKGQCSDGKGYIIVLKPDWYTGRKGSSHVFLHSVVLCEALGITEIPAGFVVHHIDLIPTHNTIHNLCLMTIEAHTKFHHSLLGKRATTNCSPQVRAKRTTLIGPIKLKQ